MTSYYLNKNDFYIIKVYYNFITLSKLNDGLFKRTF